MDASTAVLTGLGLAAAAGLNAYVPLLVVAVLGRLDVISLPAPYDALESYWAIGILVVLLAIEMLVDKVPGFDTANDVVQTVVRPLAGAVLFAGSIGMLTDAPPWIGVIAGVITSGSVHVSKAAVRPAITVSTGGVGNPVASALEDVLSLLLSLLAVLVPILVVAVILVIVLLVWRWRRRRSEKRAARLARVEAAQAADPQVVLPPAPRAASPPAHGLDLAARQERATEL